MLVKTRQDFHSRVEYFFSFHPSLFENYVLDIYEQTSGKNGGKNSNCIFELCMGKLSVE